MGSKPGLSRIKKLLQALGNPEKKLKYVHIAGTNGKGSTSLIVANILSRAGLKVGRFTSPHIHSYLERFTIDGWTIPASQLKIYINKIEQVIRSEFADNIARPTEFEVLTAIAFEWFADNEVDIAVMEVGMGGIYDSTNVIVPEISIITSVAIDHTNFLGNTLAEITHNKAGIIKRKVPVVIGKMPFEASQIIENYAYQNNASLFKDNLVNVLQVRSCSLLGYELDLKIGDNILENIFFALRGDYQLENLTTALTAISALQEKGYFINETHIRQALKSLELPGRLEVISNKPLVIIDVAHNPHAAQALNQALEKLLPHKNKLLLCGIVDDKDAYSILKHLGHNTNACIITRPEGRRGNDWQRLQPVWQELYPDKPAYLEEDIVSAVNYSLAKLDKSEYLLMCGSFFIIDKARRVFTTP
ncbi:MAG TPA: folylpolyglutamate synthase/dihydrofolate synthase family protein [Syntrophomonadaceae bacterium]|nr:folylpolyglutamate synthase/dihydrofolate synthase family protein [Syntrophomonadaceae bacterium]